LRMCGKKPQYYYFRTRTEFIELLKEFQDSSYRYLHLSCHASPTIIHTTYDKLKLADFSGLIAPHLKNRRLFVSACEIGNEIAAACLFGACNGLYSFAAPAEKIRFDHAAAIWASFYVRTSDLHVIKEKKLKSGKTSKINTLNIKDINDTLEKLCNLFDVAFYSAWFDPSPKFKKVVDKQIQKK